ncbi:alpha/beta hydrolase [Nocardia callitridis]|uniref:Alpha/beta hydrolase n=1 Tax=Nocardia callitridis TaxID=648753 RepID=A0ABP9KFL8_9NOCA
MRKTGLCALAIAVLASVVSGAQASAETLAWGACPDDIVAPGLECSTLQVPLDYRDPDGRQIDIAVSRLSSTDPAQRRGVLLTNTGGPGGAGLSFPADLRGLGLPQRVLDTYDIIGFDPRGVGHSAPVTCDLRPEQATSNIPPYGRDPIDVQRRSAAVSEIARQCGGSASASTLPFISTANTARDMDRIREALGQEKISYHGISYGTYLGAVYTTLFPDQSDRIFLDSALGPTGFDIETSRLLGQGFQDRFPDFANFAAAHPEYALGDTPEKVTAKYNELIAQFDLLPSPDPGGYGAQLRQATFSLLYYDKNLPKLAELWHAVATGDDSGAPQPDAPAQSSTDNYLASQLHVICNDSAWPRSDLDYQSNVAIDRVRFPMFGAAGANIWPCAHWPSNQVEPQVRIGDGGPSNVLIAQNLRDPATPLIGAQHMRQALGDRARMVTADQGGHLAYLFKDNACLNNTVTEFLVDGQRPDNDIACAAEPSVPE